MYVSERHQVCQTVRLHATKAKIASKREEWTVPNGVVVRKPDLVLKVSDTIKKEKKQEKNRETYRCLPSSRRRGAPAQGGPRRRRGGSARKATNRASGNYGSNPSRVRS